MPSSYILLRWTWLNFKGADSFWSLFTGFLIEKKKKNSEMLSHGKKRVLYRTCCFSEMSCELSSTLDKERSAMFCYTYSEEFWVQILYSCINHSWCKCYEENTCISPLVYQEDNVIWIYILIYISWPKSSLVFHFSCCFHVFLFFVALLQIFGEGARMKSVCTAVNFCLYLYGIFAIVSAIRRSCTLMKYSTFKFCFPHTNFETQN